MYGPVPIIPASGVPTLSPFASTHACDVIAAAFVASAQWKTESGEPSFTVTSRSPVAVTSSTRSWKVARYEPRSGSRWRLRLKATSSAVMSLPSWNLTPERSVITNVVGSG